MRIKYMLRTLHSASSDFVKRLRVVCPNRNPSSSAWACVERQINCYESRKQRSCCLPRAAAIVDLTYISRWVPSWELILKGKVHGLRGWLSRVVGYAKAGCEGFFCTQYWFQLKKWALFGMLVSVYCQSRFIPCNFAPAGVRFRVYCWHVVVKRLLTATIFKILILSSFCL